MKRVSRLLRGVEIILWVVGVSLLGAFCGDALFRWNYQWQQERAFERGPASSVSAESREIALESERTTRAPEVASATTQGPVERVDLAPDRPSSIAHDAVATTPRIDRKRRVAEESFGRDPDAVGRLEIPRLGLAAIVKEGADSETLDLAVGRVLGTAHPGEIGNMVLAGHRDTFFRPLRRIKLNDRIRMIVPPHTYEYRVQSMRVVAPGETSVLDSNGVEELTLVTCYPFSFIGSAPERFIVSAARVN